MSLVGRLSLDLAQQRSACPLDPGGRLAGGTFNLLLCSGKHTGIIDLDAQVVKCSEVLSGVNTRRGYLTKVLV